MKVIRGVTELPRALGSSVVTIGNFDGVHIAHQELFRGVVISARQLNVPAVAVTFDPHPTQVLFPDRAPRILTPLESKSALIEKCGIDLLWVIPFREELARLSAVEFVRSFLSGQLHAAEVHVGMNFSFGNRRQGNVQLLTELGRECGFRVTSLPLSSFRGQKVSSSRIREMLSAGKIELANRLLGRPYAVEGPIVSGSGVGRKQTVPTLNLGPVAQQLPATGVYVTRTWLGSRALNSVTNAGHKPTFGPHPLTIESYLLGSAGRIEADRMRIEFLFRLREERKFPDASALKAQIQKDARRSLRYFSLVARLIQPAEGKAGVRRENF